VLSRVSLLPVDVNAPLAPTPDEPIETLVDVQISASSEVDRPVLEPVSVSEEPTRPTREVSRDGSPDRIAAPDFKDSSLDVDETSVISSSDRTTAVEKDLVSTRTNTVEPSLTKEPTVRRKSSDDASIADSLTRTAAAERIGVHPDTADTLERESAEPRVDSHQRLIDPALVTEEQSQARDTTAIVQPPDGPKQFTANAEQPAADAETSKNAALTSVASNSDAGSTVRPVRQTDVPPASDEGANGKTPAQHVPTAVPVPAKVSYAPLPEKENDAANVDDALAAPAAGLFAVTFSMPLSRLVMARAAEASLLGDAAQADPVLTMNPQRRSRRSREPRPGRRRVGNRIARGDASPSRPTAADESAISTIHDAALLELLALTAPAHDESPSTADPVSGRSSAAWLAGAVAAASTICVAIAQALRSRQSRRDMAVVRIHHTGTTLQAESDRGR
jgi:hypothetical protein